MSTLASILLPLFLSYIGMASLCLAMARHHRQVWPSRRPFHPVVLRGAGIMLLLLALLPCIQAWGMAVGVVLWLGYLSAGALALVVFLAYRPRQVAPLAGLLGLLLIPLLVPLF